MKYHWLAFSNGLLITDTFSSCFVTTAGSKNGYGMGPPYLVDRFGVNTFDPNYVFVYIMWLYTLIQRLLGKIISGAHTCNVCQLGPFLPQNF